MRKAVIILLILGFFIGFGIQANEVNAMEEPQAPRVSIGMGYLKTPTASGALFEGGIRFTDEFYLFTGIVPFDKGLQLVSVGADLRFNVEKQEFMPGIGIIFIGTDKITPTASLTIQDEESGIGFMLRGGYNVFSAAASLNF